MAFFVPPIIQTEIRMEKRANKSACMPSYREYDRARKATYFLSLWYSSSALFTQKRKKKYFFRWWFRKFVIFVSFAVCVSSKYMKYLSIWCSRTHKIVIDRRTYIMTLIVSIEMCSTSGKLRTHSRRFLYAEIEYVWLRYHLSGVSVSQTA